MVYHHYEEYKPGCVLMYIITIFNEPVVKGYACYDTFLSMLVVEMKDLSSLIDYVKQ